MNLSFASFAFTDCCAVRYVALAKTARFVWAIERKENSLLVDILQHLGQQINEQQFICSPACLSIFKCFGQPTHLPAVA